ncbi:7237_t:CDS:2, partial [Scutellospora calospora]
PVTIPVVELALKEFVLNYQHKTILSDTILIEKAKLLAARLEQVKLQGEAVSADNIAIVNALPLIRSKYASYLLDRIYNIDETRLFYRLELDHILATYYIAGHKTLAYEVPDDDCAISELIEIFKESDTIEYLDNVNEIDNRLKVPIVSTDSALEGLETAYIYLLQQDNTSMQLKLVDKIKKAIKEKK